MIEYKFTYMDYAPPEYVQLQKEYLKMRVANDILKMVETGGTFKFDGAIYKEEHDMEGWGKVTISLSINVSRLH